jgi:hypothetical protein
MSIEQPTSAENPIDYQAAKEAARDVLKLDNLGLNGLESGKINIDPSEYPAGEFVSKNGILIFSTPDGVFARKSDSKIEYQLEQAGFKMNEALEVPDLNNPEVFPLSHTDAQADWAKAQEEKYEGASV